MADAVSAARERLRQFSLISVKFLAPSYTPVHGMEYQSYTNKGYENSAVCVLSCVALSESVNQCQAPFLQAQVWPLVCSWPFAGACHPFSLILGIT